MIRFDLTRQMVDAGRIVTLCRSPDRPSIYIGTAVPVDFEGGVIPAEWRAEGPSIDDVILKLSATWDVPRV